ncbi:MAG: LD-carboxypeptidase [bacterium]|nr:LD-carboxypeptidase [bacterium]
MNRLMTRMSLTRRNFLQSAAITGALAARGGRESNALSSRTVMNKPAPLKSGDAVGLVCPGSPIRPELVKGAADHLAARGYRPVLGESLSREYLCGLSGEDEARAADLNRMWRDSKVRAVFTLRGGYGANRILDSLDYGALRADPKWLTGFSDITSLHAAIFRRTGLPSLHGLAFGYSFGDGEPEALIAKTWWDLVEGRAGAEALTAEWKAVSPPQTWRGGAAEGVLLGGNLSRLASLAGTEYALPDDEPIILFLEEVDEAAYRVDRFLMQLKLAGLLDRVAGAIVGQFTPHEDEPEEAPLIQNVLRDQASRLGVPVLAGAPIGHEHYNLTLIHGARVRLDADAQSLVYLEA